MRGFLLDTHAFLWWILDDKRLSTRARATIADPEHEICFSVISAWEICIKARLGRISQIESAEIFIPEQVARNNFRILNLSLEMVLKLPVMPNVHEDPFDRMLIAQGLSEKMPIITNDRLFAKYPIDLVW